MISRLASPCHAPNFTHRQRRAASTPLVLGTVVVLGLGGAITGFLLISSRSDNTDSQLVHTVERGLFEHDVVERGEVESSENVEIRCEVKSNNTNGTAILEVAEEGTRVQVGDILVKLDSSALEQERVQQQILANTSQALMIQAQNAYDTAVIAKKEYEEGTFRQEEQVIQSELFVAEENLRRAQQYAQFSERLAAKGYVTDLQLEGDRFAVEKFKNEVDAARTKLRVLQEYTREKMLKQLESAINTAEAQWKSEQNSYKLELDKLKNIEDQIVKCEIRAPQGGTVVYANRTSRRSDSEFIVEPGALVRERQPIIRLPDPRHMQVKATIGESRVNLIKPGMKVEIRMDAFGDDLLFGEVVKVHEYPESSSWFSSQVKEYATFITIFDPPPLIRPGLTAEVMIHVDKRENVVQVPVQSVHEHGGLLYCIVKDGSDWTAREITMGGTNDKFVMIDAGVDEGEQVAMTPRKLLSHVDLPDLVEDGPAVADRRRDESEAARMASQRAAAVHDSREYADTFENQHAQTSPKDENPGKRQDAPQRVRSESSPVGESE